MKRDLIFYDYLVELMDGFVYGDKFDMIKMIYERMNDRKFILHLNYIYLELEIMIL